MVSSKTLSLVWLVIEKFDDVTSLNELKYKIDCNFDFDKYSRLLKIPTVES